MSSEYHKCKAELSTTAIEEVENEQIGSGTYFNAIQDISVKEEAFEIKPFSKYGNEQTASGDEFDDIHILKPEIVEKDPAETNPLGEYGVFNDCPEKTEDRFYDPDSSEFEVTRRNSIEDPKEAKFSPTHSWENTMSTNNGLVGELTKPKVNYYNNEVTVKNEDNSECTEDSLTNIVESKTETLKSEYDIDIIYEDAKPEICEEKSNGKNENESYLNSVTEIPIGTNFSIDSGTWLQQNTGEDGTAVERSNDTRRSNTVEQPFQCKVCLKSFAYKSKLLLHKRIHTGEKPFQCIICSKSFSEKGHLGAHERIHTGEKPFQCKICLKSFSHKGHVTAHERIHTGEKPFQCQVCPKSFVNKSTLLRHGIIHTSEKPFQCQVCLKSFADRSTLLNHERIHTGGKPFQCKICLKSFSQKGHLTKHERVHSGEKPFQCQNCSKAFADKSTLARHEMIHTGTKPFQCKICLKTFSQKVHLTGHEKIHTENKPL